MPSQGLVYWPCDESFCISSLINPCYKSDYGLWVKKHLPQMNLNAEYNPDMLKWSMAHGPAGILLFFYSRRDLTAVVIPNM